MSASTAASAPLISPGEMQILLSQAGLVLNPGQVADLVLAWRQLAGLIASIPRDRPLADDMANVFRVPPPVAPRNPPPVAPPAAAKAKPKPTPTRPRARPAAKPRPKVKAKAKAKPQAKTRAKAAPKRRIARPAPRKTARRKR
jgi:hypothetical protein